MASKNKNNVISFLAFLTVCTLLALIIVFLIRLGMEHEGPLCPIEDDNIIIEVMGNVSKFIIIMIFTFWRLMFEVTEWVTSWVNDRALLYSIVFLGGLSIILMFCGNRSSSKDE